jgi:hypothetical protein
MIFVKLVKPRLILASKKHVFHQIKTSNNGFFQIVAICCAMLTFYFAAESGDDCCQEILKSGLPILV